MIQFITSKIYLKKLGKNSKIRGSIYDCRNSGLGHSTVLRTLPLTGSLNSGYAVRYCSPKPSNRASHTRQTLTAIAGGGENHERRRNSSEKSRSLWRSIQSEMKSGTVKSAVSWLENTLKQKSEQVKEALNRFREVEE